MTPRTTVLAAPDPEPPKNGTPAGSTPANDPLEGLGLKLANLRSKRRLSRNELANRINCTWEAVLSAEIGEQPRARAFWANADRVLQARGQLLAAADRAGHSSAAIKRLSPRQQPEPTHEQVKLARYRHIQRTNRIFADRLSAAATRRLHCPHLAGTANRHRARIEHELTALTQTIRALLRRPDFTPDDVFTNLWQTLLTHNPVHASLLSAAAVMELAQAQI